MLLRRFLLGLLLLTILGCSGLTDLMVTNLTDKPIEGSIKIQHTYAGAKPETQANNFSIPASESKDVISWFSKGPDWIDLTYKNPDNKVVHIRLKPRDYPAGMERGSSAGSFYCLDIGPSGAKLRNPTQWEKFQRNPGNLLAPLGGFLCCLSICVVIVVVTVKMTRRR